MTATSSKYESSSSPKHPFMCLDDGFSEIVLYSFQGNWNSTDVQSILGVIFFFLLSLCFMFIFQYLFLLSQPFKSTVKILCEIVIDLIL